MTSIVNASMTIPSMYSPLVRCHYTPNVSTDVVQYTDVILGYNGINKLDGSSSVEIISYTVQNGNIQLIPLYRTNTIDLHA
jgi:hypothetical protein